MNHKVYDFSTLWIWTLRALKRSYSVDRFCTLTHLRTLRICKTFQAQVDYFNVSSLCFLSKSYLLRSFLTCVTDLNLDQPLDLKCVQEKNILLEINTAWLLDNDIVSYKYHAKNLLNHWVRHRLFNTEKLFISFQSNKRIGFITFHISYK